jgi:hypothetical protein
MKHSENNNEFDQQFKNAFDGFEMEPSEGVWNGIEKELDKKKKGIVINWTARLSIAASIIILITVGVYQFNFSGNETATPTPENLANNSNNKASVKVDSVTEKKVEKISAPMQPISEERRLADVVEIKSRTTRSSKSIKKGLATESKTKLDTRTQEEKNAIELLRKMEDKAELNRTTPMVEPENKRPIMPVPVPSPSVAVNTGSKTEVGVLEMLNFVAQKVSGNANTELVAVNESKKIDGSVRKKYEVNLGIVKFSRIKNTNK